MDEADFRLEEARDDDGAGGSEAKALPPRAILCQFPKSDEPTTFGSMGHIDSDDNHAVEPSSRLSERFSLWERCKEKKDRSSRKQSTPMAHSTTARAVALSMVTETFMVFTGTTEGIMMGTSACLWLWAEGDRMWKKVTVFAE